MTIRCSGGTSVGAPLEFWLAGPGLGALAGTEGAVGAAAAGAAGAGAAGAAVGIAGAEEHAVSTITRNKTAAMARGRGRDARGHETLTGRMFRSSAKIIEAARRPSATDVISWNVDNPRKVPELARHVSGTDSVGGQTVERRRMSVAVPVE